MAPSKENVIRKRKPGRPATGTDPLITMRLPPDMIAALDRAAEARGSSRSEVIRGAVERDLGLKARGRELKQSFVEPGLKAKRLDAQMMTKIDARRAIVREWLRLAVADRATEHQAALFAKRAQRRYQWHTMEEPHKEATAWISTYIGKD